MLSDWRRIGGQINGLNRLACSYPINQMRDYTAAVIAVNSITPLLWQRRSAFSGFYLAKHSYSAWAIDARKSYYAMVAG